MTKGLAELCSVEHYHVLSFFRKMLTIAAILEHSREPHARRYQKSSRRTETSSTVPGTLKEKAVYDLWQMIVTQIFLFSCLAIIIECQDDHLFLGQLSGRDPCC